MAAAHQAVGSSGENLKQAFDQFLVEYSAANGKRTFTDAEREVLFGRFKQFLATQNHR
jgi:hypothetical protein